jgi:hypothetical protein
MAKGSSPKMKLWRREAIKHNESARESGDFSGHKGRALKTHGFNSAGMPSALFMNLWSKQVALGNMYFSVKPTNKSEIIEEAAQ